jgi:type I restriction enzyme M protein
MGHLVDRTHRELSDEEIERISSIYHAWRGEKNTGKYEDIKGFCKSATLEEIKSPGYVLTPGRYVGAEAAPEDDEPFEDKVKRLTTQLKDQFTESRSLEKAIQENLEKIGFRI